MTQKTNEKKRSTGKIVAIVGAIIVGALVGTYFFATHALKTAASDQLNSYLEKVVTGADVTFKDMSVNILDKTVTIESLVAIPNDSEKSPVTVDKIVLSNIDSKNSPPHHLTVRVSGIKPELDDAEIAKFNISGENNAPSFGLIFDYSYNAKDKELSINNSAFNFSDLALIGVSFTVTDFDLDAAAEDNGINVPELLVKKATFTYNDTGFIDDLVTGVTKIGGADPERAKKGFIDAIKTFGQAIERQANVSLKENLEAVGMQIMEPGTLTATIAPDEPTPVKDLMPKVAPFKNLSKLNLEITHSK